MSGRFPGNDIFDVQNAAARGEKNMSAAFRFASIRTDFNSIATIADGAEEGFSMSAILGRKAVMAFEARGISAETAARYGIYTARGSIGGDVLPDPNGNVVVFPFFDGGKVVNEKYRGPNKSFWQRKGGRRTFWNADALDDPALEAGTIPLVVTEGEIDALTAIECGFPLAVSVPDGAPPAHQRASNGRQSASHDDDDDRHGKFEFIWNNRERLRRVRRFILALDGDAPGKRLEEEILRRLSPARCSFVSYPEGCKDLNEVRQKYGAERVTEVLNRAQPFPLRGLYNIDQYPDRGKLVVYESGWETLNQHFKMFDGEFITVTGVPSHGKSRFVMNLIVNQAIMYGRRSVVFSPEMPVVPQQREAYRRILRRRSGFSSEQSDKWISENLFFIDNDPTGDADDDIDIGWIVDRAIDAVLRYGVRILVIDPWNEVEHARRRDETTPEYIARAIRALKRFARQYGVAVIVVAHPTKDVGGGKDGKTRIPTPYDIDGAAHWFNKSDHCITIWRDPDKPNHSSVIVAKSKFEEEAGERGVVNMRYDAFFGTFEMLEPLP